jgi:hypothetical protein
MSVQFFLNNAASLFVVNLLGAGFLGWVNGLFPRAKSGSGVPDLPAVSQP